MFNLEIELIYPPIIIFRFYKPFPIISCFEFPHYYLFIFIYFWRPHSELFFGVVNFNTPPLCWIQILFYDTVAFRSEKFAIWINRVRHIESFRVLPSMRAVLGNKTEKLSFYIFLRKLLGVSCKMGEMSFQGFLMVLRERWEVIISF